MAEEAGETGRISRRIDQNKDDLTNVRLEVRTLQVQLDHAPTDEDLDKIREEVRKDMTDMASQFHKDMRRQAVAFRKEVRRSRVRTRRDIDDAFSTYQEQQHAAQKRWLSRGWVILALVVSFLVSGIEGALRIAQTYGIIPHF